MDPKFASQDSAENDLIQLKEALSKVDKLMFRFRKYRDDSAYREEARVFRTCAKDLEIAEHWLNEAQEHLDMFVSDWIVEEYD